VIARFYSFGALDHQRRVLHQSSLLYFSEDRDSSSYQVVSVIRLPVRYTRVPLDLFCFCLIVHKKATKIFTRSDLQPSLSLLHKLVLESVVLSSCPRLSLVASLDLFQFSFVSSIHCHLHKNKKKSIYKQFFIHHRSNDSYTIQFPPPQNLIRRVFFKTGITFCSKLRLR
jgi:hypothetical protein